MTGIYQKIVIATDGSEKNLSAVIEGVMLARISGAKLYIVYVIDTKPLTTGVIEESYAGMYDSLREEGEQALEQAKDLAGDLGADTFLLTGKPANEITRFVKEQGSDLLVIGTQGKSGLGKLLLGSVAESIIRTAPCSVLVVRKS
ncbi:MAG: universal stress protein [Methanomicrobiales archaeon]